MLVRVDGDVIVTERRGPDIPELVATEEELRQLEETMAGGVHDSATLAAYSRAQARLDRKAVVRMSIRKGKALGYLGILLWYWGRKRWGRAGVAEVVDVR